MLMFTDERPVKNPLMGKRSCVGIIRKMACNKVPEHEVYSRDVSQTLCVYVIYLTMKIEDVSSMAADLSQALIMMKVERVLACRRPRVLARHSSNCVIEDVSSGIRPGC